jgi:anti-sigma regulatory factor (Ser/Thr protein kinase)
MAGGAPLRDLSLHLLDLIENSISAGASTVWLHITQDPKRDLLEVVVEDDGPGLPVEPEVALNPFYTTKKGKRTGLGLALLRANAELAGGALTLQRSSHGGLRVSATLGLGHVDRIPLGDIPSTLAMTACTCPKLDLVGEFRVDQQQFTLRLSEAREQLSPGERDSVTVAQTVAQRVRAGLQQIGMVA